MAIYQRKAGIWYADFFADGKRVQVSTGTKNKREAEKFLASRMSEAARGEYSKPVRIVFSEFGKQYIDYAKANKRSWIRDEQIMVHLNVAFGPMPLPDIGAFSIERYKIERLKAPVSPATVNREIALLKHLFNLPESWGVFRGRNPMKGIRLLSEDNLQYRSLSDAEQADLLAQCSPYMQDLVVFAVNTGFRLGEILNLKWEAVDIENNTIRTLVMKTRQMIDLPLNDAAAGVIRGWHGIRKSEYVFYNPETGGQWKDLWLGLKKACRKAGLQDVTWHTMRHTFASRLTCAGADLVTIKELLGHSSITVTMRYAHTNRDAKARAVKLLTRGCDKTVTLPVPGKKTA
jgi:integrase